MPHEVHIGSERLIVDDAVEIDRREVGVRVRVHRTADGAAVIVAASDATRDGALLLGNLGIVPAGAGAIVRAGAVRMAIVWSAASVRRRAGATGDAMVESTARPRRCRVCFGAFTAGEMIVACACGEHFHDDCDRARIDCPGCGAPRTQEASRAARRQ